MGQGQRHLESPSARSPLLRRSAASQQRTTCPPPHPTAHQPPAKPTSPQVTTDLPMYRHLRGVKCANGGGDYDKATRGLGGNSGGESQRGRPGQRWSMFCLPHLCTCLACNASLAWSFTPLAGNPVTSCGEENLLMLKGDRYRTENVLVRDGVAPQQQGCMSRARHQFGNVSPRLAPRRLGCLQRCRMCVPPQRPPLSFLPACLPACRSTSLGTLSWTLAWMASRCA